MSLIHQLYLQRIREIESLGATAFDKYREPIIARLLDHAWREVPFCHDRLAPFVQTGGFNMADWFDIPLLQPEDIAANADRMLAATLPKPATEGEDVQTNAFAAMSRRSKLSRVAAECERERFYERNDIDLSATLAILEANEATGGPEGTGWSVTFDRGKWTALGILAERGARRSWLAASGARQLRATRRIAEELAEDGKLEAVDIVVIVDDDLPEDARHRLAEALQVRLVHFAERPILGPCAADSGRSAGYLVPAASNIVEVVDRFGVPVSPGIVGQLVVTPLYEYACPLLRLATGIAATAPADAGTTLGVRSVAAVVGVISE